VFAIFFSRAGLFVYIGIAIIIGHKWVGGREQIPRLEGIKKLACFFS
jgi:hypothetical protein